jgi:hypothetical protein
MNGVQIGHAGNAAMNHAEKLSPRTTGPNLRVPDLRGAAPDQRTKSTSPGSTTREEIVQARILAENDDEAQRRARLDGLMDRLANAAAQARIRAENGDDQITPGNAGNNGVQIGYANTAVIRPNPTGSLAGGPSPSELQAMTHAAVREFGDDQSGVQIGYAGNKGNKIGSPNTAVITRRPSTWWEWQRNPVTGRLDCATCDMPCHVGHEPCEECRHGMWPCEE